MTAIRNSAKAIIIKDNKLLAIKNFDPEGDWYILPGGGQQHGETLHEALQRECLEEIGTRVIIGELRFIREYIGRHHEYAGTDSDVHQVEFMFKCDINSEYVPTNGHIPDTYQTGVSWLPLGEIAQYRIYPAVLKPVLGQSKNMNAPAYLGDVN